MPLTTLVDATQPIDAATAAAAAVAANVIRATVKMQLCQRSSAVYPCNDFLRAAVDS